MKTFKRFTALVLALVMAAMLAVSAYAATVVVKYKVYVYTSQLTFKQYDYSSSTTPSTRNLTILADSSLGSGSALYHVKYVNGALAYCIQPGVRSDDSSNYVQGSSGCWYNLPASVQSGIALALACGYPSAEYGTAYGDSNSSDIIGAEKWAATQAVIWDLICEYRSPYDYRSWGSSPFYNCVDTSRYPTFALWYSEIVDAMQSATDIPSFAATSSRWCDTIELTKDSSGNYSASVTDSNGVLGDFNFSSNSGNGITFSQKGNTLTITATAEAAKGLSTEKTYSATGSAYGIDPDEAVLCWYDSTGKYQSLASYTGTGLDPVRAYIKIKATVADEVGSLTINKTDADTGKSLAGVTYRLMRPPAQMARRSFLICLSAAIPIRRSAHLPDMWWTAPSTRSLLQLRHWISPQRTPMRWGKPVLRSAKWTRIPTHLFKVPVSACTTHLATKSQRAIRMPMVS